MRRLLTALWHLCAVVGVVAVIVLVWLWTSGLGTRTPPGAIETTLSRAARSTMVPADARRRVSSEAATSESLRAGLEHWADHCASCHANNGSGDTEMGRGLYPPAPDMRLPATQQLSDGELFYLIEHGIKLTGMPAWGNGTAEGERSTWHLVQFIRRLPTLSEAELAEMEEFNPRGAAEWQTMEEERRFLAGEDPPSTVSPAPHRHPEPSR